jgi:acyl-CoA thioesterase I
LRLPAAWLVACALLPSGALVASCSRGPALPKLDPNDVILAFGDSLTYGTGASPEQSYPAVLETLVRRRVVREGYPGETTAQGLERLAALLDQHHPKLVLLCMGGNDMLQQVDTQVTERNLRSMIGMARERGVAVVLIGVPAPRLLGGAAPFYRALADAQQIPLEEEALPSVLRRSAYKSDPIHPNADGYRLVAQALAELLRKAGAV